MKNRTSFIKFSFAAILFGVGAIISFKFLPELFDNVVEFHLEVEVAVGLVGILSGAVGIIMGLSVGKKAHIEAVKEYFDKGDSTEITKARYYLSNNWENSEDFDLKEVSPLLNFYQQWGLLNRKNFLPIWVFDGASGVRVVEMYFQLFDHIKKVRNKNNSKSINNKYYAQEFENLAKRIYRKYPDKMIESNLNVVYKDFINLVN